MSESVLSRVNVVLFEPQNQINIAAVIRAMKNMGVASLRLVRPVEYDPYRVEGIAHDTADIIERITHFDDLDSALADCVHVAAYTARRRAAKWVVREPTAVCRRMCSRRRYMAPWRCLFGREDKGLPNEALDRARVVVNIPTTDHASLNLARRCWSRCIELHVAAGDATVPSRRPATRRLPQRPSNTSGSSRTPRRRWRSSHSSRLAFPSTSCVCSLARVSCEPGCARDRASARNGDRGGSRDGA
jgi:tRNA/rRNA methyltransferase/tRNA (cytidine32/uridine32-2'-O)-methyltransferase